MASRRRSLQCDAVTTADPSVLQPATPPEAMSEAPSSRPYLAMGLTFLLLGIGFANPTALVLRFPPGMWDGFLSPPALNLYALTVFLGWGHFVYAWHGQWRATGTMPMPRRASYWLTVLAVLGLLVAARGAIGVALFSLVTWVYNISHFIKAERHFGRGVSHGSTDAATSFYMPTIAFAWLTVTLFNIGPFGDRLVVFVGSLVLAAAALLAGDWKALVRGNVAWPLLTLFLLSESLVWNAYGPTQSFIIGVYVMHVAAASFFHYLGGYFFAQRGEQTRPIHRPVTIVVVNLLALLIGCAVARYDTLRPLQFLFGPEWFTLWVALHLIGSDLLPVWKHRAVLNVVQDSA